MENFDHKKESYKREETKGKEVHEMKRGLEREGKTKRNKAGII